MKTISRLSLTALVGIVAFVMLGLPAGAAVTGREPNIEQLLLNKINLGRSALGKSPLAMHQGLRLAAREHGEYMAAQGKLSHDGYPTRINQAAPDPAEPNGPADDGFRMHGSASCENVAYAYFGSASDDAMAQKFYELWYNSTSGHKECMFDASNFGLNVAGVGVVESNGRWYASLEMVKDGSVPFNTIWHGIWHSSPSLTKSGAWTTVTSGGKKYAWATDPSASYSYTFTGSEVKVNALFSPDSGWMRVTVDGAATDIDLYSPTAYKDKAYKSPVLAPGTHTVTVSPAGAQNPDSAGSGMGFKVVKFR